MAIFKEPMPAQHRKMRRPLVLRRELMAGVAVDAMSRLPAPQPLLGETIMF